MALLVSVAGNNQSGLARFYCMNAKKAHRSDRIRNCLRVDEQGIFQTCFLMFDVCQCAWVSVVFFISFISLSFYIFYVVSPKEQKTRNTDSTNGSGQFKKMRFFRHLLSETRQTHLQINTTCIQFPIIRLYLYFRLLLQFCCHS